MGSGQEDDARTTAASAPSQPASQSSGGPVLNVPPKSTLGQRILKAGFVVLCAHGLLKICGILQGKIIPNVYGGEVSDVFVFVYGTLLGTAFSFGEQCLAPALLPVFAEAQKRDGEARAWQYCSVLFNIQFMLLALIAAGMIFFAQPLIGALTQWDAPTVTLTTPSGKITGELRTVDEHAYTLIADGREQTVLAADVSAPGRSPAEIKKLQERLIQKSRRRELGGEMLPYIAPGLIGMSLASLTYVVLNGYKEFFFAALGDAVLKLCVLLGALAGWAFGRNWRFIAAGAVIGGAAKLATHLFALGRPRLSMYRLTLNYRDPYLRSFVLLVLPLLAGIFVSSLRDLVIKSVLTTEDWLPTYFDLGRKVVDSAGFLVPYTLSIALLPFFCDLSARNDTRQLGAVLTQTIRMLLWFFVPVTVILVIAAVPVCFVFYSGEKIGMEQVKYPAMVMKFFALQLPFAALEMMVMQAFFSSKRMIAPTVAGLVFSVLTAAAAWWLVIGRQMTGTAEILTTVVLCMVSAKILKSCVLVGLLKSTVPVLPWLETLGFLARLVLSGLGAVLAASGAAALFERIVPHVQVFKKEHLAQGTEAACIAAAGAGAYLALSYILRMEEPRLCWRWSREKLQRRRSAQAQ